MRTPADHMLITIKARLNLVPIVGGALATLVAADVPEQPAKAAERMMERFVDGVSDVNMHSA